MTAIRTDSSAIAGLYGHGIGAVAPGAQSPARQPQAFGDFSSFDGSRFGLSGTSARQDPNAVASDVAQHLTERRDNAFG